MYAAVYPPGQVGKLDLFLGQDDFDSKSASEIDNNIIVLYRYRRFITVDCHGRPDGPVRDAVLRGLLPDSTSTAL